jgi:hypothetical protein
VTDRRVLPERADLVNNRETQASSRQDGREPVQERRVRMHDLDLLPPSHLDEASGHLPHQRKLADERKAPPRLASAVVA